MWLSLLVLWSSLTGGMRSPKRTAVTSLPIAQAVCGDGVVQWGEACDDGNSVDFDGCTNACAVCAPTWPGDDADLDGLNDPVDPDPADPWSHLAWTDAGSAAPVETRTAETVAASWDGWLLIGSHRPATEFENTVRMFRPEAVDRGQLPLYQEGRVTSAPVPFDVPDPSPGNLHVAVYPDAVPAGAHGANPYRSDASGAPDPDGAYETYKLGWIGTTNAPVPGLHFKVLMRNRATVVVSDPRTPQAAVLHATWDDVSTPLTTLSGDHLWRYEPTVSIDGRLIFWNSADSGTNYSFNPTPGLATGWSEARPLPALYYEHGAGSPNEPMVDGLRFSERYPIAAEALKDSTGQPFTADDYIPGPYPWLSWDATDLMIPVVANFRGAVRSGLVGFGKRTNWHMMHLDGPANPARAELASDQLVHFTIDPEGALLEQSYRLHTVQDGVALGPRGYDRILMSNVFQTGSMWDPFAGLDDPGAPWLPREETFGFFTSTLRMVEVSVPHVLDGHTLLSLPMNEQIAFDRALVTASYEGPRSGTTYWEQVRQRAWHQPDRAQDTSGYAHQAILRDGAAFPYEYHDAHGRWSTYLADRLADPTLPHTDEGVWGDRLEGIVGQAVFFPGGSSLRTNLVAEAEARLAAAEGTTLSLWFKRLQTLPSRAALVSLQTHFWTRITDHDLLVHFGPGNHIIPFDFPVDAWTHIAIRTEGNDLDVFLDGELVYEATVPSRDTPQFHVAIGPHDSATTADALFLVDELELSDVARTHDEIRARALRRRQLPATVGTDLGLTGPLSDRRVHLVDDARTDEATVTLGEMLFFDPALSRDGTVSCASCHQESRAWTDGHATAFGIDLQVGERNTPTLANRAYSTAQFWDGRAASLEAQVLQPISLPHEMDLPLEDALQRIASDPTYVSATIDAFGHCDLSPSAMARALAAYVRTLESPPSPFDLGTMSDAARRGQALFEGEARCSGCHTGPAFTDERFHDVGLVDQPGNEGRFAVTGRETDRGRYKTPTLRELTRTAPYFHDGRFATLAEVVDFYDAGGDTTDPDAAIKPLALSPSDKADLVAFLQALSAP